MKKVFKFKSKIYLSIEEFIDNYIRAVNERIQKSFNSKKVL